MICHRHIRKNTMYKLLLQKFYQRQREFWILARKGKSITVHLFPSSQILFTLIKIWTCYCHLVPGNSANNRTSWQQSVNLLNLQCRTGQKQLSHSLKCIIPMNKKIYFFLIFQGIFNVNIIHLAYFVMWIFALFTCSNFIPISSDNLSTNWWRTELPILYSISDPAWYFEAYVQSTACRYGPERPMIFRAYTGLNLTASMATGAQPLNFHYLLLFCFILCKFEIPWWGCVDRIFFLLLQSAKLSIQYVSLH